MDLAKGALSALLYFVPPPLLTKLEPALNTAIDQLRTIMGVGTSLDPIRNSQCGAWTREASAPLICSPQTNVSSLSLQSSQLRRRPKTTISVKVEGSTEADDGLTIDFPVPATATSVHLSFEDSATGQLGIAFALSSNERGAMAASNESTLNTWGGFELEGRNHRPGLQQSRPLARDVVTYLELLYCAAFIGGWVLRAMGPLMEWAKSVSKVALAQAFQYGALWLARLLRLILANLPETDV